MLHLSIWKQMRSTCQCFICCAMFNSCCSTPLAQKPAGLKIFVWSRLFVRLSRQSVIRLMSLFDECRSTTFCSSPPPPIPSPPLCPTKRRERNPPHNAPFRTRMCCVALWQKPSTTQVTSPKVASMPGQCTPIRSPSDDSIFNLVHNPTRALAVSEDSDHCYNSFSIFEILVYSQARATGCEIMYSVRVRSQASRNWSEATVWFQLLKKKCQELREIKI